MDFSAILGLLVAALSLLGFVEQHPNLPQSSVEQAKTVAQKAIVQATSALKNAAAGVKPTVAQEEKANIAYTSADLVVGTPSGSAPLTVRIEADIKVSPTNSGSAVIFFGDGTSDVISRSGPETYQEEWTHTYPKAGAYDVVLVLSSVANVDNDIQVMKDPAYAKNQVVKKAHIDLSGKSTVQLISWDIVPANPYIMNQGDSAYYEQKLFIDATSADGNTTRYDLGTSYGCIGSNEIEVTSDRTTLGRMDCSFDSTEVEYVAYAKGGKFFVEKREITASGFSGPKTKVLVEI